MASRVAWRFKSTTTSETVAFEGPYISVGELKREIVEKKGLSRDHAAELLLSEAQSGRGTQHTGGWRLREPLGPPSPLLRCCRLAVVARCAASSSRRRRTQNGRTTPS
jgi:hypothetical protein